MKMLVNTEKCCGHMESHTHRKASAVLLLSLKHQAVSQPVPLKTLVKETEAFKGTSLGLNLQHCL